MQFTSCGLSFSTWSNNRDLRCGLRRGPSLGPSLGSSLGSSLGPSPTQARKVPGAQRTSPIQGNGIEPRCVHDLGFTGHGARIVCTLLSILYVFGVCAMDPVNDANSIFVTTNIFFCGLGLRTLCMTHTRRTTTTATPSC